MKLKYFLLLIVLLLISLEAGLLIYYGIDRYSENIENFEKLNVTNLADDFENALRNYDELKVTTDYFLKNTEVLSKIILENVNQLKFFADNFRKNAEIEKLVISNYSGKILYNHLIPKEQAKIGDTIFADSKIMNIKFENNKILTFYSAPIKYNDKIIGGILAYKNINEDFIKRFAANNNIEIFVSHSEDSNHHTVGVQQNIESVNSISINFSSISLNKQIYDIDGNKILFVFKRNMNPIKAALYKTNRYFVKMNIIIAFLVYVFGYIIIHFFSRSLKKLAAGADRVAAGEYTPLKKTAVKEINSVIQSFNKMSNELKKTQNFIVQQEKLYLAGKLASGMAHELNNPLVAALGYSQMLLESDTINDEKIKNYLKQIEANILRARSIVKSLRSYSVMKNTVFVDLKLHNLIDECISLVKYHTANKKLEICNLIDEEVVLNTDSDILKQVIINLLMNSIDATANTEQGRIEIKAYQTEKNNIIEISDNGGGIDEKTMPLIFEPFFTTKPEGKGSGLGLFLCYNYMKQLNGDILLNNNKKHENNYDKGITVKLFFNK